MGLHRDDADLGSWTPMGALPPALGREGFDLGYGARGGQMPLGPFWGISSRRLLRRAVAVEARVTLHDSVSVDSDGHYHSTALALAATTVFLFLSHG